MNSTENAISVIQTLDRIKQLIENEQGDPGRLRYIYEFIRKGKSLYRSDRQYLEKKINAEIIFGHPGFSLLSGNINPNFGLSVNTQGDTSSLYGGILWEWETQSGVFFDLGLGAAVHNGELETDDEDKKSLGSRVLFRIPIELGYSITTHHRISILFVHMSNANLADPNQGLDELGVRYGYRF